MKYFPNFHFCGPCCDECYETNSQEESEMSFTEARRIVEDNAVEHMDIYSYNQFVNWLTTKLKRYVDEHYEVGQLMDITYNGEIVEVELEKINDTTVSVVSNENRYRIPKEIFPSMVRYEH